MSTRPYALILFSVLCSSFAHVALKLSARTFSLDGAVTAIALRAATNGWLIAGIGLHVFALMLWVLALKNASLSYVYPFTALGFALVTLLSWQLFGEQIGALRLAGVAVIILGVALVAAS
jgi:multidrug transporter EmrE-like cation transporter